MPESVLPENVQAVLAPSGAHGAAANWDVLNAFHNLWIKPDGSAVYVPTDMFLAMVASIQLARTPEVLVDAATVTPSLAFPGGELTSLSQGILLANPSGAPYRRQPYLLSITSGASRAISYDTQYRANGVLTLPTATTGSGKTDYLGFLWNTAAGKWDLVGKTMGY